MGVVVGVLVEVPVAVGSGVLVAEGVNVGLSVAVGTGVCVAVSVGAIASTGVLVLVGVSVGSGVGVLVGVSAGIAVMTTTIGAGVGCGGAKKRRMSSLVIPANAAIAIIATTASSPHRTNLPRPLPPFPPP